MATDFGAKDRPRWRRGQRLAFVGFVGGHAGLVAGFLIFASLPTMLALSMGAPPGSDELPKVIPGKPCRTIPKAVFDRGWRAEPRVIHFQAVAFARRRGDIFCNVRHDGPMGRPYPICEFDAPVELGVVAGGRDSYFDVGAGYSAVVEARPEGPRCRITGLFRYYPSSAPKS